MTPVGLRRQAVSGASWTAVATLFGASVQILQVAVLARFLRPEDFGLMALVTVVIGLAQTYADAGTSGAIVHRQQASTEHLSSLFWLNVLVGIAMALIVVALAPVVAGFYAEPRLTHLLWVCALAFLVTPVGNQMQMRFQRDLQFGVLAGIDALATVAGASVAVALAISGQGVWSLVWGFLASGFARSATLLWLGLRDWAPQWRLQREDLRGYLRFGAFQIGERTVNYLSANLDKLLIGSLLGAHALGLYSVTYQLVMKPLRVVAPVFNRVAFPLFAKVQKDPARLKSGFLDGIGAVAFVLFPAYAGAIVLAEPLVMVVLGEQWRMVIPVLQVLSALAFFYSLGNPLGSLLLATGRVEIGFYLNVWRLALFTIAITVGAHWNLLGVAAALLVATVVGMFPLGFFVRWFLVSMRPVEYLRAFLPMLLCALAMATIVWAARHSGLVAGHGPLFELVTLSALGIALYAGAVAYWLRGFLGRLRGARA